MKKFLCLLVIICSSCGAQKVTTTEELRSKVDSAFNSVPGNFAIAFKQISEPGTEVYINEKENFHAASTMKTPVMIEVFRQAEKGEFSLGDSLLVKNEFRSIVDGSSFELETSRDGGEKLYEALGEKRPIKELVTDMIIHSSNLATNLIIETVDAKKVNKTMRDLGAMDINVLRGVEDMKAYEAGLSNSTTALDLAVIFEKLARGEAVSPEADRQMLEILEGQMHREIIPAQLPPDVRVANKTGMISGVHHDSGLVTLPSGESYVLVLLSKNMEDMEQGTKMLADVSKMVYDFVSQ